MSRVAGSDEHDGPQLSFELVPGIAAVIEQSVSGIERLEKAIVAHVLPEVLLRV